MREEAASSVAVAACTAPEPSTTRGIMTVALPCWSPNMSDQADDEPSDTWMATVAPPNVYDRVPVRSPVAVVDVSGSVASVDPR